jgi:hypothetical protein
MRYVILEERDEIEQRCLKDGCKFINPVFAEPRRNCPLCHGPLGAFPAYGTEAERSVRLRHIETQLRAYTD